MRTVLLIVALALGLALAQPSTVPSPPLCRVVGSTAPSRLPWLESITVTLRPGCPPGGEARVLLMSRQGATDPQNGYQVLTPCAADSRSCTYTWRGVLRSDLGWRPRWIAASGRIYDIPLPKP